MEFKRARSASQKEERKLQIKAAAVELLVEKGYNAVTFAKIAEGLSIKRPLLYTYYETPADILLDAAGDHLTAMEQNCLGSNADETLELVLDYILADEGFKRIIMIYSLVIEPIGSYDQLVDFKKRMATFHHKVEDQLKSQLPNWSDEQVIRQIEYFWTLLIGMLNMDVNNNERQMRSYDHVGLSFIELDIKQEMKRILKKLETL